MDSEKERQKNVSLTFRLIFTGCLLISLAVCFAYARQAEWIGVLIITFAGISFVSAFYLDKRI
jgi:hypothetical protein